MDQNEKVIEMMEAENTQETSAENNGKKRFRDTKVGGFIYQHRKIGFMIIGAITVAIGAAVGAKIHDRHCAEEDQIDEDQKAIAEDWMDRALLEDHEAEGQEILSTLESGTTTEEV